MSAHGRALLAAIAIAATCSIIAGGALAGTSAISGSVPNGGCDAARPAPVNGPSRIEIEVSSTSADNSVFGEILAQDGAVLATDRYDTPGGGNYSVRVCSHGSSLDPPQIQYNGLIGTGPAGQPVLHGPAQPQPVLGAVTLLKQTATGRGAIMTNSGLAWFTLSTTNAKASLRVYDPIHHATQFMQGLHAVYGSSIVTITGNGVKFVLLRTGAKSRITYTSPRFRARGQVVRGNFDIVA